MTVSTTTDAPVDLGGNLPLLPVAPLAPGQLVSSWSGIFGPSVERAFPDVEPENGSSRGSHTEPATAAHAACLFPSESILDDHGPVEGVILGANRVRRSKTADGFVGPSVFLVNGGKVRDEGFVPKGVNLEPLRGSPSPWRSLWASRPGSSATLPARERP